NLNLNALSSQAKGILISILIPHPVKYFLFLQN
ncbi:MAG: hypothetical protein ACI9CQ_004178, partial [Saprospiraceae bacterium]